MVSLVDLLVLYGGCMALIVCGVCYYHIVVASCDMLWSRGVLICYLDTIVYLELLVLRPGTQMYGYIVNGA